jgi:hypothetical protein
VELPGRLSRKGREIGCSPQPASPCCPPFVVSEEAAVAIRTTYEQEGELSAAIELRRLFPGITDNAKARECARSVAGWKPLPAADCQITPLRLRGSRARPTKRDPDSSPSAADGSPLNS